MQSDIEWHFTRDGRWVLCCPTCWEPNLLPNGGNEDEVQCGNCGRVTGGAVGRRFWDGLRANREADRRAAEADHRARIATARKSGLLIELVPGWVARITSAGQVRKVKIPYLTSVGYTFAADELRRVYPQAIVEIL